MGSANSEDVLLLGDNAPRKRQDVAGLINSSRNPDLVETLKFFKKILDVKLGNLKTELIQEQNTIKKKVRVTEV